MRNREGFRRCNKCLVEFEATPEFFPKDANRILGIGYQCRSCANEIRRLKGDKRKNRWLKMTPTEREKRRAIMRKYNSGGGWRCMRIGAYRAADKLKGLECDLTAKWFKENIQSKPCIYCKRTDVRIGCDRIDNTIGHTMANVVPSCGDCNKSRQDIFTHEEMILLGPHIAAIFSKRVIRTQNA